MIDEVLKLLEIAEISVQWPNLKRLHDHALARLEEIQGTEWLASPGPAEEPEADAQPNGRRV